MTVRTRASIQRDAIVSCGVKPTQDVIVTGKYVRPSATWAERNAIDHGHDCDSRARNLQRRSTYAKASNAQIKIPPATPNQTPCMGGGFGRPMDDSAEGSASRRSIRGAESTGPCAAATGASRTEEPDSNSDLS